MYIGETMKKFKYQQRPEIGSTITCSKGYEGVLLEIIEIDKYNYEMIVEFLSHNDVIIRAKFRKKSINNLTTRAIINLQEGHFFCTACRCVLPNSEGRQKEEQLSLCKKCNSKKRTEAKKKNPQHKIRTSIYKDTHLVWTGRLTDKDKTPWSQDPNSMPYKRLGCNTEQLRRHISSQFEPGWTIEGRGSQWELDHIKGFSEFDLTDEAQMFEVSHYTNLRPLPIAENRRKRGK